MTSTIISPELLQSAAFKHFVTQSRAQAEAQRNALGKQLADLVKSETRAAADRARARQATDTTFAAAKAAYEKAAMTYNVSHNRLREDEVRATGQQRAIEAQLRQLADPQITTALEHLDRFLAEIRDQRPSPDRPLTVIRAHVTELLATWTAIDALRVTAGVDVSKEIRRLFAAVNVPSSPELPWAA